MAEWIDIGLPEFGPGSVGDIASHTAPVYRALHTVAEEIRSKASLELLVHRDHGHAHIGVKHSTFSGGMTDLDSYVYLQDPNNFAAAASIENGHWTGSRKAALGSAEGPLTRQQAGQWVPGIHPLGKAIKQAVAKGRGRAIFR